MVRRQRRGGEGRPAGPRGAPGMRWPKRPVAPLPAPSEVWGYEHRLGSEVRLFWNGYEYFRQHLGTDRGDRPHADPVSLPGGPPLTCFAPHDHVWHTGFWFNWKFINAVNYWENGADGRRPDGVIRFDPPERLEARGDEVAVTARYTYVNPLGKEVGREVRRTAWRRPCADGGYVVDCSVRFRAGPDPVTLDRTPITAQTPWGGYGGLSWRFSRGLGAVDGLDAAGRRGRAIEHQRAAWATMFGRLDGGPDLRAGVAIFDHPTNRRHPTPWRFIDDPGFAYLNPSPLLAAPLELAVEEELALRYSVLVYPGAPDPARLAATFAAFATTGEDAG